MKNVYSVREALNGLSCFTQRDVFITSAQMRGRNFNKNIVKAVAARCKWGMPQVILCRPVYKTMPFPTLFWLTCPYLSHLCGMLESAGAVKELEEYLNSRAEQYRKYVICYILARLSILSSTEIRFLRFYRPEIWSVLHETGIGGIRGDLPVTVKCIHLHTAAMMGLAGHPARSWLVSRFSQLCCKDGLCQCLIQSK
jgi:hypothetical protein